MNIVVTCTTFAHIIQEVVSTETLTELTTVILSFLKIFGLKKTFPHFFNISESLTEYQSLKFLFWMDSVFPVNLFCKSTDWFLYDGNIGWSLKG